MHIACLQCVCYTPKYIYGGALNGSVHGESNIPCKYTCHSSAFFLFRVERAGPCPSVDLVALFDGSFFSGFCGDDGSGDGPVEDKRDDRRSVVFD